LDVLVAHPLLQRAHRDALRGERGAVGVPETVKADRLVASGLQRGAQPFVQDPPAERLASDGMPEDERVPPELVVRSGGWPRRTTWELVTSRSDLTPITPDEVTVENPVVEPNSGRESGAGSPMEPPTLEEMLQIAGERARRGNIGAMHFVMSHTPDERDQTLDRLL
jgi:hypothetical protein